jgi:serine/threonine protein phosphatase 1
MLEYPSKPERFLTQEEIETLVEICDFHNIKKENSESRTFAIGDVHGFSTYLLRLLDYVTEHCEDKNLTGNRFVFLGDYVDRGPDSSKVIATIRLMQDIMGSDRVIALCGNHEDMLLEELYMSGYGVLHYGSTSNSFDNCLIPGDVVNWIRNLPLMWEDELHYYVHAGFNKKFPIDDQYKEDLIWIREEFLNGNHDFGKHVFHGHTPKNPLERKKYRTNLDTGACFGGQLTAAEIKSDQKQAVGFFCIGRKYGNRIEGKEVK